MTVMYKGTTLLQSGEAKRINRKRRKRSNFSWTSNLRPNSVFDGGGLSEAPTLQRWVVAAGCNHNNLPRNELQWKTKHATSLELSPLFDKTDIGLDLTMPADVRSITIFIIPAKTLANFVI
ncbi:hypothetical protein PIB30_058895 [Stylosanthes scabra]|uniref:Uncharacterized protein n=1 Tax=Stylosanthes scabra TaxID=79078 RepID=A0ABU6ZIT9_9FABA|nr:hypothetical protein [Stylosanthes scabra]